MNAATKRDLVGRRIVAVDFRRFSDGRGYQTSDPVLTLDNGATLSFSVRETESLAYGIDVSVSRPKARGEE